LRLQRRKYGGYLVHLGVILMALGIIGTRMYPYEVQTTINAGQSVTVGDYTLIFEELKSDFVADYSTTWANVSAYRGDTYLTTLQPQLNRYTGTEQTITIPALHPDFREDLYLILSGWTSDGAAATFKVVINSLVNFLWLGGLIFLAGGGLALWPRMENRTWNVVALVAGLVLLLGAGWAMWGMPHGSVSYGGRPLVGQEAPDFRLSLLDGETTALADLRGQIVVVNFWASWCPSCVEEMPDLQDVWEAYQDKGVTFLGVAYQDDATTVRNAMAQYGTTYPVGLDAGDRIAEQYGITGIPETFIVAPDGRVAYVHVGPITGEALTAQLDMLLK
jgi:cytochrome c-type biogenesis protein CcmF